MRRFRLRSLLILVGVVAVVLGFAISESRHRQEQERLDGLGDYIRRDLMSVSPRNPTPVGSGDFTGGSDPPPD